jgi:plastocyanin
MRVLAVLAVTALTLGACGDDDDGGASARTSGAADATAPAATEPPATEAAGTEPAGTEAAGTEAAGTEAAGGEADIVIAGFEFPAETRVAAGEPITVRNDDVSEHTVTAIDGTFNVTVGANATATIDGLEPGTYEFVCNFHGGMEGTLVVE